MKHLYYSLLLLLFTPALLHAQVTNPDEIFNEAQQLAQKKSYDAALKKIDLLTEAYPDNEDYIVYKGRIYSWKKYYAKAIEILKPLADKTPPNPEAQQALINTYFWSLDYSRCLEYCNAYLQNNPYNESVLLVKAACLEKLNRDDEAIATLDLINKKSDNDIKADDLREIISRKKKNAIALSYLNVSTDNPGQQPLHYGYIEYTRKLNRSTIVGRINSGHAFDNTNQLYEADYYYSFNNGSYVYANAGVSDGDVVFPKFRAGAQYYFKPYRQFEYSLGARYMDFENDDVTLITGHLGYNISSYLIAYRPFYDTENQLFTHTLSLQKTNEAKESIIRFELQYGNLPYVYVYNNAISALNTFRAGIQYQHRIGKSFFVRPVFMYEYEEYIPDSYRNRFNAQIILTKRF